MNLTSDKWYVRYYLFSLSVWATFRHHNKKVIWEHSERTNLCHFIRVCFVYCPLIILWHVALTATAVSMVTWLPIYLFGIVSYGSVVVFFALVFAAAIALLCGAIAVPIFFGKVHDKVQSWADNKTSKTNPSFFAIMWQWMKAVKGKYCPMITINGVE